MSKHTEGPWGTPNKVWIQSVDGKPVAWADSSTLPREEQEANARLIAAAPEMLAMLTDNVDSMHCALSTGTYEGGKGWLEDAIEATDTLLKRVKGVE